MGCRRQSLRSGCGSRDFDFGSHPGLAGKRGDREAKAYTANAFSLDSLALSTAQLYTLTQPGHSLNSWGSRIGAGSGQEGHDGLIFFGGGVPLYKDGRIIGGLGISGDTASCDHEIAERVRNILGLEPARRPAVDDISYSSADGASVFTHPLSINTWRNGVFIGNESPAMGTSLETRHVLGVDWKRSRHRDRGRPNSRVTSRHLD